VKESGPGPNQELMLADGEFKTGAFRTNGKGRECTNRKMEAGEGEKVLQTRIAFSECGGD